MTSSILKLKNFIKGQQAFWIISILVIFMVEVFGYNYRFWESLFFDEIIVEEISPGDGIRKTGENTYSIIDSEGAYFEINDINAEIKNIFLEISVTSSDEYENRYLPIRISATDEANEIYREFSQVNVVPEITESKYIRLYLSGETEKIKVSVDLAEGGEFMITDVGLNVTRPFCFHPLRVVCFLLLVFIFQIFRPKSNIYEKTLDLKEKRQKYLLGTTLILNIMVICVVSMAILPWRTWANTTWPADTEYESLTDALIDGHFYLNEEPSETLKKMDNPYDPQMREKLHQESGETYLTDYAYFNGKYYCYFGIVPALIFFVPFKLLFGVHLPAWLMVSFCAILYCIVSYIFVYTLVKRYFKKISIGLYLIFAAVFVSMSSIVYLAFFATVYSVPIMLAMLLGIMGLTFWLKAEGEKLKKRYLVLGALSIALIIGCRPQLAIILLFAFPIFWKEIKNREFFSKKGLANTLCVIIPFLVVGCAVMYYNYARFGNVFDFGANYNLTGNDMTHRGTVFARNWLGIFEYLFQPLNVASKFPFLRTIGDNLQTDYQGYVSYEPLFGGFLWFNPICCVAIWGLRYRVKIKQKGIQGLTIFSFTSAVILILLTIQMSGLTQRYMSDFGWLMAIGTILMLAFLNDYYYDSSRIHRFFLKITVVLSALTVFLNYFNIFILERYGSMISTNPKTLFWVKYVFFAI